MKKYSLIILVFFLSFSNCLLAQNDTIWYNSNWNIALERDAAFYRLPPQKQERGYLFKDYYMSGKKQMEGISLKINKEIYDGLVIWYYENGNIFQKVNYVNGVLEGERKIYFKNGILKTKMTYIKGKKEGKWKGYYENGKLNKIGFFKNDKNNGKFKSYYKDGELQTEGKYLNGKKVGEWNTYYYKGMDE